MNGRQPVFHIPTHPVARFLSMIALGAIAVAALILGAFAFVALLAVFGVGYAVFRLRAWLRRRTLRARGAFEGGAKAGPDKRAHYIEGEYEVIEARAELPRGRPNRR